MSVSLATAEKNNLKQGNVVELSIGDKKIELPVLIQPGLHDDVMAVAVGYGRTRVGKVGNGIGKNAFAARDNARRKNGVRGSNGDIQKVAHQI